MSNNSMHQRFLLTLTICILIGTTLCGQTNARAPQAPQDTFGEQYTGKLETLANGQWWKKKPNKKRTLDLNVPRDQVVAFALYTHDHGTLKLSAQLFPLMPDEAKKVTLEFKNEDDTWKLAAEQPVIELGWSAHFRIENWDNSKDVVYRVRHGEAAQFEGLIRKDPVDKEVIVVGNLSCNSSRTPGPRPQMLANLEKLDPDLLFFAGDQSYWHTEHTYGWLEFGMQFRDVLKDRPVVTIPDDHDIGQANLWGENGKKATNSAGPSGGYFYPGKYVNMVQRCQTWHLPDPFDATRIEQEIETYYTDLTVGGINFAILEDRKFKSGPAGKIPKMGPRPDHINDPKYERSAVDLPELKLLGDRQLDFLSQWTQDWTDAEMKCVLSQTAFCGAVHLHGRKSGRLLADLDSNAWPQAGRNKALTEIRRAWAPHLCGDQHLGVFVKHGINEFGDGPYAFTSPAIVNTIYGRWWWPEDEQAGPNPVQDGPLPWTGDYLDGLGNRISMIAYANPSDVTDEQKRADGFGIARFNKKTQQITVECWPRFSNVDDGDAAQFPGWPITFQYRDNDGRSPQGFLPEIIAKEGSRPVVQVIDESNAEILYTVRSPSNRFKPPVYSTGPFTVKVGLDRPDQVETKNVVSVTNEQQQTMPVELSAAQTNEAKKADDAENEWIQLFNGKDLSGWTAKIRSHEFGVNYADTFRVRDGVLAVCYDDYKAEDFTSLDAGREGAAAFDKFGHLFYKEPFSHYLLRIEYRFVGQQVKNGPGWARRNNGVMIHGQDPATMAVNQKFPVSIEVQLLGGDGTNKRSTMNLCTPGTNVFFDNKLQQNHCHSSTSQTFHGDQWVTAEIEVRGSEVIRHSVGGQQVMEYFQPQLDPRDAEAKPLIVGGKLLLDSGTLSLQSESAPTEFRKIELKKLN